MKKISLIMMLVCVCFCTACKTHVEYGYVNKTGSEIINRITNDETFFVMIINDDSYSCDVFMEDSEAILEEKEIVVYVVNEADVEDSIKDQLEIALGTYSSWPTLFYVKEGSIPSNNRYEYSLDPEGWQSWMESINKW